MQQPDAPEGVSRQSFTERTTEHRTDGVIVIHERTAETALGGSQDWAEIVKQYTLGEILKRAVIALVLLCAALAAGWKEWPSIGWALAAGSILTIFMGWQARQSPR